MGEVTRYRGVRPNNNNWGNNPDNDIFKPSSYIMMLANDNISFKMGLQGLTVQSTVETELVAAALTTKEAVLCSNIMLELGFDESFGGVSLYINNTLALHVASNRTYSLRAKHIALSYFFVQEVGEKGNISIQLADLGTEHLSKYRHHDLIKFIDERLRLETPTSSPSSSGRPSSCYGRRTGRGIFIIILSALGSFHKFACTLYFSFVAGSSHYLAYFLSYFRDQLRAMDGQTRP